MILHKKYFIQANAESPMPYNYSCKIIFPLCVLTKFKRFLPLCIECVSMKRKKEKTVQSRSIDHTVWSSPVVSTTLTSVNYFFFHLNYCTFYFVQKDVIIKPSFKWFFFLYRFVSFGLKCWSFHPVFFFNTHLWIYTILMHDWLLDKKPEFVIYLILLVTQWIDCFDLYRYMITQSMIRFSFNRKNHYK